MLSENEFLIGLGGVGGRTLLAVSREWDERKDDIRQTLMVDGRSFEYLYIDTDSRLLHDCRYHHSCGRIESSRFICLHTELSSPQRDKISPWLSTLNPQFQQASWSDLCGTEDFRRVGHMIFENNAASIQSAILLHCRNFDDVNFRIFCSLGEGPGSGGLINLLTLLHTISQEHQGRAHIFVYAFLGGKGCGPQHCSFFENEYAALRDLNALMVGRHQHHSAPSADATETAHDGGPIIERVYLSSESASYYPDLQARIEAVATACVDMMLYCGNRDAHNGVEVQRKKQSNRQKKAPNTAPGTDDENSLLSRRFAAVASRRWYIPKEEIKDYLKAFISHKLLEVILNGTPLPAGVKRRDIPQLPASSFDIQHSAAYAALRQKQEELATPLANTLQDIQRLGKYHAETLEEIRIVSDSIVEKIRGLAEKRSMADIFAPTYQQDLLSFYKKHLKAPLSSPLPEDGRPTEIWGLKDILRFLHQNEQVIAEQLNAALSVFDEEPEADDTIVSRMQSREQEWKKPGFWTKFFTKKCEKLMAAQAEDARKRIYGACHSLSSVIFTERNMSIVSTLRRLISSLESAIRHLEHTSCRAGLYAEEIQIALEANTDRHFFTCSTDFLAFRREHQQEMFTSILQHSVPDDFLTWFTENDEPKAARPASPWMRDLESVIEYEMEKRTPASMLLNKIMRFVETTSTEACSQICRHEMVQKALNTRLLDFLEWGTFYDAIMNFSRGGRYYDVDLLREKIGRFVDGIRCPILLDGAYQLPPHLQDSRMTRLYIGLPRKGGTPSFRNDILACLQERLRQRFNVPYEQMDLYLHDSDDIRVAYTPCDFRAGDADVVKEIAAIYQQSALAENGEARLFLADIDDDDTGLAAKSRPVLVPPPPTR